MISETNSSVDTRYLYTGREFDEETGLYYYRARYYDASVGRFISEDAIGFGGRDTNLYRYVSNNSVTFSDPSGLFVLLPPISTSVLPSRTQSIKIQESNYIEKLIDSIAAIGGPCCGINADCSDPNSAVSNQCVSNLSPEKRQQNEACRQHDKDLQEIKDKYGKEWNDFSDLRVAEAHRKLSQNSTNSLFKELFAALAPLPIQGNKVAPINLK